LVNTVPKVIVPSPFSAYARYKGPVSFGVNFIFPCIAAYALEACSTSLKIRKQYDFPGSITMLSAPPYGNMSSSNCSCCRPVINPAFATITYWKKMLTLKFTNVEPLH
jgi:hypothetical protein